MYAGHLPVDLSYMCGISDWLFYNEALEIRLLERFFFVSISVCLYRYYQIYPSIMS